jgi:hypothetical protein
MTISHSTFLEIRNLSEKVVEKMRAQVLCYKFFLGKSCCLWDNVGEFNEAAQATDGGMIQGILFVCRVTNAKKILSECVSNAYCFSTTTMITRTRYKFMLNVSRIS